jgi:uncharacterized protein (TIGR02996 family)
MNPSAEQRGLWAAIAAAPEDDTPRLVYADWLDDHGDHARAEFIRVQCALAPLGTDRRKHRKKRGPPQEREKALLAEHKDSWAGLFCRTLDGSGTFTKQSARDWLAQVEFRRGFLRYPYHMGFGPAMRLIEAHVAWEPMEIGIGDSKAAYRPAIVPAVASWEHAACITGFSVSGASDGDVRAILDAGRLTGLTMLGLWLGWITDEAVRRLAQSPLIARLTHFDLQQNRIGDSGAQALAESPYLSRVQYLHLWRNPIGPAGRRLL